MELMAATELMDPTAAKIVLSAQRGDSINRIAQKARISYSWTYEWIERLEANGIIVNTDNGIEVIDHDMRRHYRDMMAALVRKDGVAPDEVYVIPHFARMRFAFTEIDAAFVWTHGGYQIARSHEDYPIFIQVHDQDVERWIGFFEMFGMDTAIGERPSPDEVESDVYGILYPTADRIERAWVDGNPVIPLDDAVEQMTANRAAYEPALEIIADEHGVSLDASHHGSLAAN